MDCACEDEAGVDGFVDKEKPEKEPELPDAAAAFVTPNPVKELTAADVTAELAVENNGADDVPKDKEAGFDTAEPDNVGAEAEGEANEKLEELDEEEAAKEGAVVEVDAGVELAVLFKNGFDRAEPGTVDADDDDEDEAALPIPNVVLFPKDEPPRKENPVEYEKENTDAGDDDEAGLPNPKEEDGAKEKPEVLEEVEAAAVEAAVVFELPLLEENGEPTEKGNPAAPKGDVVAEFEAELDENKPENDGVVTVVAVEADEDEDAKLKGLVADEDENREEPLLAPNRDEDVPNPPEKYKFNPKRIGNNLLV
ncbi:hypothetical protein GOBAR_AA22026 [Gossypium barbadense]|uniref:Uncharacterized protein n=1 Tax=Gossypium barbadense TaxID=3634 RepID=A0A2P5X5L1_GOSBA|nr:hypothetical protein GOBAR_AA22026 [Gossypium barbadense]